MRAYTRRGLRARHCSGPTPSRSATPGRKPSSSTSACSHNRSTTSAPPGCLRSTPMLRRPRSITEYGEAFPPATERPLATSAARSTRSTSAPRSESNIPANCTGPMFGSSITLMPSSGPTMLPPSRPLQREDARGVLVQELGPHVVAERHVRQLGEDAVDVETHGVIARVDDLVGAARVREVDDVAVVVLGGERRSGVVEVRPLEQQLHHQLRPGFAAVARDDLEFREEPADFVE